MTPQQRFAARADHGPNARRVGAVRVKPNVLRVGRQIVGFDDVGVGFFRSDVLKRTRWCAAAHDWRADLGLWGSEEALRTGRWRSRLTRYQHNHLLELGDLPR